MTHKFPRVLGSQDLLIILPYLKLTFSHLKMDAWKMILSFLGLKGQFLRCQLAVSFRDATCFQQHVPPPKQPDLHLIKHNCWTPRHWWYSQGRCGWSAFCCLSLSSSENHGGWNHRLVRRKANILADCCHSFKKSWTLYLQLVPSSYHWTFLLAWSWSQGCQGSVPLLYRCTQDLYETKLRNPQVGDSYWKLPRLEILWANTPHPNCGFFKFGAILAQCSKRLKDKNRSRKSPPDTFDAWNQICPPETCLESYLIVILTPPKGEIFSDLIIQRPYPLVK